MKWKFQKLHRFFRNGWVTQGGGSTFVFILLCLNSCIVHGQQPSIKNVLSTNIKYNSASDYEPIFDFTRKYSIVVDEQNRGKSNQKLLLNIFSTDGSIKIFDTIDTKKELGEDSLRLVDIALIKNTVYFLFKNIIAAYDFNKKKFIKKESIDSSYHYIKELYENKLLIFKNYNSSMNESEYKLIMSIVDVGTLKIDRTYRSKEFQGIGFSHFAPFDLVDCTNGVICVCKPLTFDLIIYNEQFEIIDSLRIAQPIDYKDNIATKTKHDSLYSLFNGRAGTLIMRMFSLYQNSNRIDRIKYLSQDSILVFRTGKTGAIKKQRFVDLISKTERGWEIEYNSFVDRNKTLFQFLGKNNYPLCSY